MLISDSIQNEYLDNAHYDIGCAFPKEYERLNDIVIAGASGLAPFVLVNGELRTQEFTVTCIVTSDQDLLLQKLYKATMHPEYTDQRYPIQVSWGPTQSKMTCDCYLKSYTPPRDVNYGSPAILNVTLTLRSMNK